MRACLAALAALTLAALSPLVAAAQGVCVECKEPNKDYRCTVKDSEKVHHIRGAGRAVEFICISEIARIGGHQSCRVNASYAGPCIGQHHEVDVTRSTAGEAAAAPSQSDHDPASSASAIKKDSQAKGPPQTLEELARNTVSKSKEQMSAVDEQVRKTGSAVGGSLKKTWDCLTSLFNRC